MYNMMTIVTTAVLTYRKIKRVNPKSSHHKEKLFFSFFFSSFFSFYCIYMR